MAYQPKKKILEVKNPSEQLVIEEVADEIIKQVQSLPTPYDQLTEDELVYTNSLKDFYDSKLATSEPKISNNGFYPSLLMFGLESRADCEHFIRVLDNFLCVNTDRFKPDVIEVEHLLVAHGYKRLHNV